MSDQLTNEMTIQELNKESLRALMCLYAQVPDEVVKDVQAKVGAYIDALIQQEAKLREALQEFVNVFEKADGNVLAILSKETMIKAKEALASEYPAESEK